METLLARDLYFKQLSRALQLHSLDLHKTLILHSMEDNNRTIMEMGEEIMVNHLEQVSTLMRLLLIL